MKRIRIIEDDDAIRTDSVSVEWVDSGRTDFARLSGDFI